jgi:hypothetical protein
MMGMYERKDAYYRQAKKEGYRSRAAFKLTQIARKEKAVRAGDRAIDAGAAPGGWSQVLLELVGKRGKVAAIDLLPVSSLPGDNFRFWQRDLSDPGLPAELLAFLGGRADVVLSDAAPNTTGSAAGRRDVPRQDLRRRRRRRRFPGAPAVLLRPAPHPPRSDPKGIVRALPPGQGLQGRREGRMRRKRLGRRRGNADRCFVVNLWYIEFRTKLPQFQEIPRNRAHDLFCGSDALKEDLWARNCTLETFRFPQRRNP